MFSVSLWLIHCGKSIIRVYPCPSVVQLGGRHLSASICVHLRHLRLDREPSSRALGEGFYIRAMLS